jgi:hypothetical protein
MENDITLKPRKTKIPIAFATHTMISLVQWNVNENHGGSRRMEVSSWIPLMIIPLPKKAQQVGAAQRWARLTSKICTRNLQS